MKRIASILIGGLLAANLAGAATTALQAVDAGGAPASSANYSADQSLGGAVGLSSAAAPETVARHGYVGQLADPAAFAVVPEAAELDEGDSLQLDGVATMDDDTALAVGGDEVSWAEPAFPLAEVSTAGVATASNVYEDTLAVATGSYSGVAGEGSFWVRNVGTDDFDTYADDGLPDDWQVGYFGVGNPDGGPAGNVDVDPFDNTGEWIADTDPTDDTSYFHLAAVSNQSGNAQVWFDSSAARVYSLQSKTNLTDTDWQSIAGQTNLAGSGTMRSLVETNPSGPNYYRVEVQVP